MNTRRPYSIRSLSAAAALCAALSLASSQGARAQQCPSLVWSDDFAGTSLDGTKWTAVQGDGCNAGGCGWGNGELQTYLPSLAEVENGRLLLRARKVGGQYESARISSGGKGDFYSGRFEARIKTPIGKGLWGGFWMAPSEDVYGKWPQSGEIDIMEYVGQKPTAVFGAVHYGPSPPNNQYQIIRYDSIDLERFSDGYHVFAMEKESGSLRWYVDDALAYEWRPNDVSPYNWPFDERFHMILSLAVGGMAGDPDAATAFPQALVVDYVRIYDGPKPQFVGNRFAEEGDEKIYTIENLPASATVSWTVPAGSQIRAGQGSGSAVVRFGPNSGSIQASITSPCGAEQISMKVDVESTFQKQRTIYNFDDPPTGVYDEFRTTGVLTEKANPQPSALNPTAQSGFYRRDSSSFYDALFFDVPQLGSAFPFVSQDQKLMLDLYTDAPAGTEVIVLFHDSSETLTTNWPVGRHSMYVAATTKRNEWERIELQIVDQPDSSVPHTAVDQVLILFAPATTTGHEYVIDNFDIYEAIN